MICKPSSWNFPSPQDISEQPAWQVEKKVVLEGEWHTGEYLRDPGHKQFVLQSTSKPSLKNNCINISILLLLLDFLTYVPSGRGFP
jgi:hypothetical protein